MARTDMFIVAESILDPEISEYRERNLMDWTAVESYAEIVFDISLTATECDKVRQACLAYLSHDEPTSEVRYAVVEGPLSEQHR